MAGNPRKQTVVEYLNEKIRATGKPLDQLAAEAGWADPTPLRLVLEGKAKLAINLAGVVAKTLNVDQEELIDVLMSDYMPQVWAIVSSVFEGLRRLSPTERRLVKAWRQTAGESERQFRIVGDDRVVAVFVSGGMKGAG